jgi:hypothetical protein
LNLLDDYIAQQEILVYHMYAVKILLGYVQVLAYQKRNASIVKPNPGEEKKDSVQ